MFILFLELFCLNHTCHCVQVGLYFYNKLYRGNRVTKVDTSSFNAFSSPNLAPLAICEVDITSTASFQGSRHLLLTSPQAFHYFFSPFYFFLLSVNWDTVWRANTTSKFHVSTELNRNVGLLRLFPGITSATVRAAVSLIVKRLLQICFGGQNHRCLFFMMPFFLKLLDLSKKQTNNGRDPVCLHCTVQYFSIFCPSKILQTFFLFD